MGKKEQTYLSLRAKSGEPLVRPMPGSKAIASSGCVQDIDEPIDRVLNKHEIGRLDIDEEK